MKYRLKDQMLQKKLDEISGGDFSKTLDDLDFLVLRSKPGEAKGGISISFGPIGPAERCRFKANFSFEELEEVPEYDPHGWNEWPKVTPPEGVLMRVEFIWNDGSPGRCCGKLWNGVWVNSDDLNLEIECVKRFRPWEDEE